MITSSQRTFCYRFQKLTVTWYKTDINFINLAYCLDIVTGVVIIISIIFLISITSGIMKVRRHNYGYKVQGECPHTINQLEKQHTHLERQIAAFYTDIPRVSRGQAKASTKKILTLAKKNTNTDSFPNRSLTKCFLGEKKKKKIFLYLLFLYIYFFWLFSEHILYQLIWGKRNEKIVWSITLNIFLSRVYICHLSAVGLGKNSIQVFVLSRNEAWIWLKLWSPAKFIEYVCLRKKALSIFFEKWRQFNVFKTKSIDFFIL